MAVNYRLVVAVSVVVAGGFVLIRSYLSTQPLSIAEGAGQEVSAVVLAALDSDRFGDHPDLEDIPDMLVHVRESVREEAKKIERVRILGDKAVDDLASAFVERLQFMLSPDAVRDYVSFEQRGDPRKYDEWVSHFQPYIDYMLSTSKMPGMDFDGVEVQLIVLDNRGEQLMRKKRFDQGYGAVTGTGVEIDILPENPAAAGMVVVEVVMPIERMDMIKKHYASSIQGYCLAWSPRINKWIPYESVVYTVPGNAFGAPPL